MKTKLIFLLLLLPVLAMGQIADGIYWESWNNGLKTAEGFTPKLKNSLLYDTIPGEGYIKTSDAFGNPVWKKPVVKPDIFKMLLEYEKECLKDTIRGIEYDPKSLFLNLLPGYKGLITREQMEMKDYKIISSTFYGTHPWRYDYLFRKEPTLKGFIQWYKTKIK